MSERIYYATQQVAIGPTETGTYVPVKGGQTISISQNFPTQEIFQLGKLEIYAQLEDLPDMEVTATKVIDGCTPIYLLATTRATTPTLIARTNQQSKLALSIFDVDSEVSVGAPLCTAELIKLDVSSLTYTFTNEGAFEESVSFVGNDIVVSNDTTIVNPAVIARRDAINITGLFTGDTDPCTQVNQRQHLLFEYLPGAGLDTAGVSADPDATILPTDIAGISSTGTNEPLDDGFTVSVQSITISSSLTREEENALGTLAPTCRYLQTPVEVTTEISFRAYNCPLQSATPEGILSTGNDKCSTGGYNLTDQSIRVATCDGTRIYLGRKNRLTSVNYGGGDTTGGNVVVSNSYRTFNDFTVMHQNDIADNQATWWPARATYLTAQ